MLAEPTLIIWHEWAVPFSSELELELHNQANCRSCNAHYVHVISTFTVTDKLEALLNYMAVYN